MAPEHILFLSDRIEGKKWPFYAQTMCCVPLLRLPLLRSAECRAAAAAGFCTAVVVRPGNAPLSDVERREFPTLHCFDSLRVKASEGDPTNDGAPAAKRAAPPEAVAVPPQ